MIRNAILIAVCLSISFAGFAQQRRKPNMFGGKLAISENTPNPFALSGSTTISYRAIDAYVFFILVFDSNGEIILRFENLKSSEGEVTIYGSQLSAGEYRYALCVNGRMGPRRKMTVLP